jgi:hypothetical protein
MRISNPQHGRNHRPGGSDPIPGGMAAGPSIYVGTPDQVAGQVDRYGTNVSDLIAANPAPFNVDPWIPFQGSWNNAGLPDGYAPVGFFTLADLVIPFGACVGGASGSIVFYFPVGYRPKYLTPQNYPAPSEGRC